jgi:predicted ATPase
MAQSGNQAALRPPKVFVGRTGERRQLESGLERARHGNGTLFVITGEPGIGKTYLAEEIADGARSSMQVLWGSCREEAGSPAYWPWVQVLESCLSATSAEALWPRHDEGFTYLAELVPSLHRPVGEPEPRPPAESQDVRFYLFDAVSRLLRAAAVSRPLLVVFDDLHAADVPSLMLLQFVAAELKAAPLVLIATHRDTPLDLDARRSTLLAEIGRRAQRLRLGGLREEEVGDYLTRTFEVAQSFLRRRGGPPACGGRSLERQRVAGR